MTRPTKPRTTFLYHGAIDGAIEDELADRIDPMQDHAHRPPRPAHATPREARPTTHVGGRRP